MTPTYKHVLALCEQKQMNLKELCEAAGVNYMTVWKWQQKEPMQFDTMRKLEQVEPKKLKRFRVTVKDEFEDSVHELTASSDAEAMELIRADYDRLGILIESIEVDAA